MRDYFRQVKKPLQAILFIIYIVGLLWLFVPHFFHHSQVISPSNKTCPQNTNLISASINDQSFSPPKILAKRCDHITFTNNGQTFHQIAFGDHPQHLIYPGYTEEALKPGEKVTILLTAPGNFKIHDHIHEDIEAELVITN